MKGKMMSLTQVQGKTRPFYVMVQEHLYHENVNDAPSVASRRAMMTLGVTYATTATMLIGLARLGGMI